MLDYVQSCRMISLLSDFPLFLDSDKYEDDANFNVQTVNRTRNPAFHMIGISNLPSKPPRPGATRLSYPTRTVFNFLLVNLILNIFLAAGVHEP
jgi:hypothetical protein